MLCRGYYHFEAILEKLGDCQGVIENWTNACAPATILPMMPESRVAASTPVETATQIVRELYGFDATARALPGEYDDNFHLQTEDRHQFVLKIMHPLREESIVDMQCRAFIHLAETAPRLPLPRVQPTAQGKLHSQFRMADGTKRLVWMLSYLRGNRSGRDESTID